MDKRTAHHVWTRTHRVKPWYFLLLAFMSAAICVFALRANYQHMVRLRSAVYTADQNGGDVQVPLKNLQAYVTRHMNTNLSTSTSVYPPIQLQHTYDRLVKAQADAAAASNSQLYTAAQAYCEQQDSVDFSGHNRVPCIEQYVQSHDTSLAKIPDALYKFAFVSPRWSPDLAGWSELAAIVFGLLFVAAFALDRLFRRYTR